MYVWIISETQPQLSSSWSGQILCSTFQSTRTRPRTTGRLSSSLALEVDASLAEINLSTPACFLLEADVAVHVSIRPPAYARHAWNAYETHYYAQVQRCVSRLESRAQF